MVAIIAGDTHSFLGGALPQVPLTELATAPHRIAAIDMRTVTVADLDQIDATFALEAMRSGQIDRFVGWFTCDFDTGKKNSAITLDTGPGATPTHWHQMVFHLAAPLQTMAVGASVGGRITLQMSGTFHREMNVHLGLSTPARVAKSFTVVIVPDTTRWAGVGA